MAKKGHFWGKFYVHYSAAPYLRIPLTSYPVLKRLLQKRTSKTILNFLRIFLVILYLFYYYFNIEKTWKNPQEYSRGRRREKNGISRNFDRV